jgi:hypothetical protein
MKKYTTFSRKYKDQADCKNFGKQFDSMFDSMGEMFGSMSSLFNTIGESSITEEEDKTVIKKDGKTYVIDKDGKVTVNGKQMVEMCDKPYNPYNYTAAECNANKVTVKLPANAMVHKDLESDMEVISRGELKRVIHENSTKLYNIYWYIGMSFVMSCSLAILISCLICK